MEAHMFLSDTWLSMPEGDSDDRHMSFQLRIVPCYAAMLWGILTVDIYSISHGWNFAVMVFGVVGVYFVSFLWLAYSLPDARNVGSKLRTPMDPKLQAQRRAEIMRKLKERNMTWVILMQSSSFKPDNSYLLLSGSSPHALGYCRKISPEMKSHREESPNFDSTSDETSTKLTSACIGDCCALCLESYQENERIVRSDNACCVHWYHEDCFMDYLMSLYNQDSKRIDCPTCRQWFCSKEVIGWNDR